MKYNSHINLEDNKNKTILYWYILAYIFILNSYQHDDIIQDYNEYVNTSKQNNKNIFNIYDIIELLINHGAKFRINEFEFNEWNTMLDIISKKVNNNNTYVNSIINKMNNKVKILIIDHLV